MDGDLKKLRACMVCGLVKTFDEFLATGCPNCESFLSLKNSPDRVMDSTTSTFSGLLAVVQGKGSWVVRWQRLEGKYGGLYAVKVVGRLTEDLQDILEARRIRPVVAEY